MAPTTDKVRALYKALNDAEDRQESREIVLRGLEAQERALRASLEELLVKQSNALEDIQAGEIELKKLGEEIEAEMQQPVVANPEKAKTPSPSLKKTSKPIPPSDRQLRSRATKSPASASLPSTQAKRPPIKIRIVRPNLRKRGHENDSTSTPPPKRSKHEDSEALYEKVTQLAAQTQEEYNRSDKQEWLTNANSKATEMGLTRGRIPFGTPVNGSTSNQTLDKKARAILKSSVSQSTERVMRL